MFFAPDDNTNTSAFEPSAGQGNFASQASKLAYESLNPKKFIEGLKGFENAATTTARNVFGQIGPASDMIQSTTLETYRRTLQIGATLKDNFEVYQAIGKSLQRNVYLTDDQLTSLVTLQQTTNLTADEIATMVTGFQDLGQGTDNAIKSTQALTKTARTYGLNVNTFLKNVGDNIKLVNSYGFKDGVEGLGRMVARAQALRMDFKQLTGLARDLLSPEKAIELAAEFQTLGGEIGALGDPFKLMYMAENDMEGLQNTIIDAAKSAVMFNEETGEFKLTGVEMRRLRAQADALGLSYEDMANTAVKAAKEQRVMESLDFTGLNKDQKQLIANLSEIGPNGQIKLNVPGFEKVADVTKLTEDQFKALEKYQETANMSESEIARKSLSIQDEQLIALRGIASAGLLAGGYLSGKEGSKGEDLEALLRSVAATIGAETSEAITNFVEDDSVGGGGFDKAVTSFVMGSEHMTTNVAHTLDKFGNEMSSLLTTLPTAIQSAITNGIKDSPFYSNDPVGDPYRDAFDAANQYSAAMGGVVMSIESVTVEVDKLLDQLRGTGGTTRNSTDVLDGYFPPGTAKVISGPEGSFSLHPDDMVIAGTKLFPNDGTNSTKNTNVNLGGTYRIDINVNGADENMFNNPALIAKVRDIITSNISSKLGNTTAGYV